MSNWPDSFRLKTRKYLDGIDPFPCGDILHIKNTKNFFAYIKKIDLLNGEIIIYDKDTKQKISFCSAGELFDAGWVVDMKKNRELRILKFDESKVGNEKQLLKFKKS